MSQVFISYKSEDKELHDKVKLTLQNADITCWSAPEIEPGAAWRDYIDTQLEQSFAVVVIVANKSMKSHYVTYEWAWASGFGLPIVTLLFEDTEDIHPRLSAYQSIDCREIFPANKIVELLQQHRRESPRVRYVNQRIGQVILPLKFLMRISLWSYSFAQTNEINFDHEVWLFQKTGDVILELADSKLPEFWLSYSHAFTPQQRRKYDELDLLIGNLWNHWNPLSTQIRNEPWGNFSQQILEFENYRTNILDPMIDSFAGSGHTGYVALDTLLADISDKRLKDKDGIYMMFYPSMSLLGLRTVVGQEDADFIWKIIKQIVPPEVDL